MKESEIKDSLLYKRVFFKRSKLIEYWFNFLFLSFGLTMILISDIESDIEYKKFPISLIVLISLILLLFWHKIIARKFEVWEIKVSEKQFKDASLATAKYLDWYLENNTYNYLKANKDSGFQWDGIDITAIRTKNEILFNSMPAPSIRSNPFSFKWNYRNKKIFKTQLIKALNGDDVVVLAENFVKEKDEKFWSESELSAKNLSIRLVAYPLIILFIGLSVFFLYTEFSFRTIIVSGTLLYICGNYLFADLKIIKEKKRRK